MSFMAPEFSGARILTLGCAFEQAAHALRHPIPLSQEIILNINQLSAAFLILVPGAKQSESATALGLALM
jgi:hypothetical protein